MTNDQEELVARLKATAELKSLSVGADAAEAAATIRAQAAALEIAEGEVENMQHDVALLRLDVSKLTEQCRAQAAEIARLSTPAGAASVLLECKTVKAFIACDRPLDLVKSLRAFAAREPAHD